MGLGCPVAFRPPVADNTPIYDLCPATCRALGVASANCTLDSQPAAPPPPMVDSQPDSAVHYTCCDAGAEALSTGCLGSTLATVAQAILSPVPDCTSTLNGSCDIVKAEVCNSGCLDFARRHYESYVDGSFSDDWCSKAHFPFLPPSLPPSAPPPAPPPPAPPSPPPPSSPP
eukprot:5571450-Prymnesium_polylepis.1